MTQAIICGSMAFDTLMTFDGQFNEHILPQHIEELSVSFLVPQMRKDYGGCAGNIAYNVSMLGGNAAVVASVGKDAQDYLAHLQRLGVNIDSIRVVPDMFTAQCFITTDLSSRQITAFHPGAMSVAHENDLSHVIGQWAIVAPDSKEGMFAHAQRLKQRGVPFVFDLGQAMPLFDKSDLEQMLSLASVLTVNHYEGEVVSHRLQRSMEEIAQSLEAVIVTHGAQGSDLYVQGKKQFISAAALKGTAVDPTGCGDAHRGGLLYGLTQGWSWEKSAKLANLMGAIKVVTQGPQNHWKSKDFIKDYFFEAYGEKL